jgi:predicted phosphodiesterase
MATDESVVSSARENPRQPGFSNPWTSQAYGHTHGSERQFNPGVQKGFLNPGRLEEVGDSGLIKENSRRQTK